MIDLLSYINLYIKIDIADKQENEYDLMHTFFSFQVNQSNLNRSCI